MKTPDYKKKLIRNSIILAILLIILFTITLWFPVSMYHRSFNPFDWPSTKGMEGVYIIWVIGNISIILAAIPYNVIK